MGIPWELGITLKLWTENVKEWELTA